MNLGLFLRYLAARLRHWDSATVRYLQMGFGIEQRARTLAPFWAEHLNRTRAAQARWSERANGDCLTVLGAGRLLDFNRMAVLPRFQKLRLVDADPLCLPVWKELPKPVDAVCVDISGCLDELVCGVRKARGRWAETLRAIRDQRPGDGAAYRCSGDALLSLNLLSQLQILWQDRVEAVLQRRFGKQFVAAHEAEWLDALRPAGQMLVEQHLAAVEASAPRFVLLITDLEYLEYQGRAYALAHWAPPPVEWSVERGWSVEQAIRCEVSPALEGVDLDEATLLRWMPSYRLMWQEFWLWHIEPQGTERVECGKVHRVGAFALELSFVYGAGFAKRPLRGALEA